MVRALCRSLDWLWEKRIPPPLVILTTSHVAAARLHSPMMGNILEEMERWGIDGVEGHVARFDSPRERYGPEVPASNTPRGGTRVAVRDDTTQSHARYIRGSPAHVPTTKWCDISKFRRILPFAIYQSLRYKRTHARLP